jgi:DNA-binding MarR family transcriptional regulator
VSTPPPDGGPALFRLVRYWSRRWAGGVSGEVAGEQRTVAAVLVVEAVHTIGTASGAATVGAVAHQLGLDQSGASRMVRDATAAGFLARAESTQDRRRAALQLTEEGHALLAASHDWQRHAFHELTADWDEDDRVRFAGYLVRLAGGLGI